MDNKIKNAAQWGKLHNIYLPDFQEDLSELCGVQVQNVGVCAECLLFCLFVCFTLNAI